MNIHEYQAKRLLNEYGVTISAGRAVLKAADAEAAAKELPGPLYVVKAQIHAGGRGKGTFKEADAGEGGGVRLAKSAAEATKFATEMRNRSSMMRHEYRGSGRGNTRENRNGTD